MIPAPTMAMKDATPLLRHLAPARALVVGDLILDRYAWGTVDRISPEAPIQILRVDRDDSRLGGAGNVAANLVALGTRTALAGCIGRDLDGRDLERLAREAGTSPRFVVDPQRPTIVKTRFLAQNRQILRVDREATAPAAAPSARLLAVARRELARADLLVLSDYAKGALHAGLVRPLIAAARRRGIPVVAGPKRDLGRFRGATALSLNLAEAAEAAGVPLPTEGAVVREGERLRRRLGLKALLITRGKDGMTCLTAGRAFHIPTRARSVYDVTGAGDTVLAVFALALAGGARPDQAATLANAGGGIVVGKLGAATASRTELSLELGEAPRKLKNLKDLLVSLAEDRRAGRRIVFTNGCFDLVHAGHVKLLEQARACGDRLVVGLNSDRSVLALKGAGRPLVAERERAALLTGLASVDAVILYDELTPARLIKAIRPDVLIKGGDYAGGVVVGRRQVEADGGEVRLIPLLAGASSSRLIARIRALPQTAKPRTRRGHAAPARTR